MTKKKHFRKSVERIQCKIWDVEFLLFKLKKMREEIRVQYDAVKENKSKLIFNKELVENLGMEGAKNVIDRGPDIGMKVDKTKKAVFTEDESKFIENISLQAKGMDTDLEQLEKQMESLDNEMSKIEDNLEGFYSLLKMLKEYIIAL